ncbi:hypothetical protein X753_19860 [Mesorhizobium sp. LNJC399B00]|uniref:SHOCT domain-containing protein n=1 Tax=unclassified Mesorhizobium TaxID=325217 RepID=UPI0003CE4924|nr:MULTISPECIES: SHOCT domain-containing protein [unclassified Mesorhizobium]ESY03820.1 hypothetical protein X753_19860 [Mesorhizobium sp. LNJC399B00]WJI67248.1 SHOCT domain-containing protein [Mesorhizobium sp. C399B]
MSETGGVAQELERLAALRASGVLTEKEFAQQKASVLSGKPDTRKKGRLSIFWLVIMLGGAAAYYYVNEHPEALLTGLPTCNSTEARNMVENMIAENSTGLDQGRKIVRWLGDSSSKSQPNPKVVVCRARVSLNSNIETGMNYKFEQGDDDKVYISADFDGF